MEPTDQQIDVDELMREIERYLDVVAAFRAAGCDVGRRARPDLAPRRRREP